MFWQEPEVVSRAHLHELRLAEAAKPGNVLRMECEEVDAPLFSVPFHGDWRELSDQALAQAAAEAGLARATAAEAALHRDNPEVAKLLDFLLR